MVETEGYEFANPGTALLLQDGKIDESLFIGDGLHPNNRGYELIAGEIASSNKKFLKNNPAFLYLYSGIFRIHVITDEGNDIIRDIQSMS